MSDETTPSHTVGVPQTPEPADVATNHPVHQSHGSMESEVRAIAVALMGWLVPGLGHALQKMWGRAVAIFLAVGCLVYLGAGLRGNLFAPGGEDAFERFGYAARLGTGGFFWGGCLSRGSG